MRGEQESEEVEGVDEQQSVTGFEKGGSRQHNVGKTFASGSMTFSAQQPDDGEVTVDNISVEQPSTAVVTYAESSAEYVAGVSEVANNMATDSVTVSIDDSGGFPGDHTAWLFDNQDLSSKPSPGDDISALTSAALDSATASVSAGTLSMSSGKVVVPKNGSSDIVPAAYNATQLTVQDLWIGWPGGADADDGSTADKVSTESNYEFSWSGLQAGATPSLTVAPDGQTYVGGTYKLTMSAADSNGSVQTTATLEITETETTGQIAVTVEDDVYGDPVPDATVEIYFTDNYPGDRPQEEKQTDSNGNTSFDKLPVGKDGANAVDYEIEADATGYTSNVKSVSLDESNSSKSITVSIGLVL